MDPIFEITAAPHLPSALRPLVTKGARPDTVANWLNLIVEYDVEIEMRDGEIYILPLAA